jgi:hypothetical protein
VSHWYSRKGRVDTRRGWGFWGWLDHWTHRTPFMPNRVQGWVCDRFDRSLNNG